MTIFERRESEVRTYSRAFPAVFEKANGPFLYDTDGKRYIDFFCGAGSLNYGHNPPAMTRALQEYIGSDGVVHSLDMSTSAKGRFLEAFESVVLQPRDLDYKVQFTGPTGTNAVEAALKLARKIKRRSNVVAFTRSYHGLSSGSLSVTANSFYRNEAFVNRLNVSFLPYDGYFGEGVDSMRYIRQLISDPCSGVDIPAAIIVETVQAEGGIHVAGSVWLQELECLCREFDILLIVDDIQVGCGRTGTFFSFERAGIYPDIVLLSKSISGYGLPMSLVLIRTELDQWKAGEHTGTFRGNNFAFVTATEALRYWENETFSAAIFQKSQLMLKALVRMQSEYPEVGAQIRGTGMIYGLELPEVGLAEKVSRAAFKNGLIIELCGRNNEVLKFLPPLLLDDEVLEEGLEVVNHSLASALACVA
jgi:diaminobutyrate-2-oxoglutarate transaminase